MHVWDTEEIRQVKSRLRMGLRGRWVRIGLGVGALPVVMWAVFMLAVVMGDLPAALEAPVGGLVITDAQGATLLEAVSPAGGRQAARPLARISPHLRDATLAAEDHRFFQHDGVDLVGVARALWLNLTRGRAAFGASTITMQLARALLPRAETRGLRGKLRQAIVAVRLERRLDKAHILEAYLARIHYGHGAWGADAAARLYLGKPASALSAGEAAFLAVLPRGPRRYDPFRHPGRVEARRRHILGRMADLGWLAATPLDNALRTKPSLHASKPDLRAPHFVEHVLAELGDQARPGMRVATTLDGPLQRQLEVALSDHLDMVGGRRIGQAGLVVMRNTDGAILAMVGSRDYFDHDAQGAVNVTTIRRRPGSTLKPFVYALAIERGDSPATLALDVVLPGESQKTYTADVRQHGFARYREALAGSYNLAAIHTLAKVGAPALVERLRQAGLSTLDRPLSRYGLDLAIGEAEFTVLEYAGAFAAFGNEGKATAPHAVQGASVATAIFSPEVAYLVFDMLSDPDARRPMFGQDAPVALPFPIALKTGTTRAYTDNLAFGTTREFTVGAWAGNFDGSPTAGVMAMQGAAPLVRAAFVALAARFGPPTAPKRPRGLYAAAVCPLSGARPGPHCPHRKPELFVHAPREGVTCPFHQRRCGKPFTAYPPEVRGWARAFGVLEPDPCESPVTTSPRIVFPADGARFMLDSWRPARHQRPPLRALNSGPWLAWTIDGQPAQRFVPTPGRHVVSATSPAGQDQIEIVFE